MLHPKLCALLILGVALMVVSLDTSESELDSTHVIAGRRGRGGFMSTYGSFMLSSNRAGNDELEDQDSEELEYDDLGETQMSGDSTQETTKMCFKNGPEGCDKGYECTCQPSTPEGILKMMQCHEQEASAKAVAGGNVAAPPGATAESTPPPTPAATRPQMPMNGVQELGESEVVDLGDLVTTPTAPPTAAATEADHKSFSHLGTQSKCCTCKKSLGMEVSSVVCSNFSTPVKDWIDHYVQTNVSNTIKWIKDDGTTEHEGATNHEALCVATGETVDFTVARWWDKFPCVTNACLIEKPATGRVTSANVCSKFLDQFQKTALNLQDGAGVVAAMTGAMAGSAAGSGGSTVSPGMTGSAAGSGGSTAAPGMTVAPGVSGTPGGGMAQQEGPGVTCRPACNTTCGNAAHLAITGVTEATCGKAKVCRANLPGTPPGSDLEPGMFVPGMEMVTIGAMGTGTCAWKSVTNAPGGMATSILSKGTADGKSCQVSMTHTTRIVDFNGLKIKGYFIKATVCKNDAQDLSLTNTTNKAAMWPSQEAGKEASCSVRKILYRVDDQALDVALRGASTVMDPKTKVSALDVEKVNAYRNAARNAILMVI